MDRVKSWFIHNQGLKLISLVLGFLVWIIVVNMSNPKVVGSVNVPFDVLNEKSAISSSELYSLSTSTINISYDVRTKYRSSITSQSFTAYINLEDYSEENPNVPVYLEVDASVADLIAGIHLEPATVTVYKEKIQQKKFAVHYEIIGQVANGCQMDKVVLSPEYIYVKGPLSVMGQISSVGIEIDVDGASETFESTSAVKFYDANGNQLNGIEDSLSFAGDITYTIPVYRIKTLTVNAFTGGAPASGYAVESVETNPTFISVYGPEDVLNEYSYILIPSAELNINGITENKTFNIPAANYIPEGLKLVEPKTEITILVKVKSIQKETVTEAETTASPEPPSSEAAPIETDTQAIPETLPEVPNETVPETIPETVPVTLPDTTVSPYLETNPVP